MLFAVALPELDFTNPGDRPKSSLDATKVSWMMTEINYRQVGVDGIKVFCREAGPRDSATILLVHGFPRASHMLRDLIPSPSDRFGYPEPIYYADELRRLETSGTGITVTFAYTRITPENWTSSQEPIAYVYGPTAFVEIASDLLTQAGYAASRFHTERFGPTGAP